MRVEYKYRGKWINLGEGYTETEAKTVARLYRCLLERTVRVVCVQGYTLYTYKTAKMAVR